MLSFPSQNDEKKFFSDWPTRQKKRKKRKKGI